MTLFGLAQALEAGLAWQREGGAVVVHVIRVADSLHLPADGKMVFGASGRRAGEFHPTVDRAVEEAARDALRSGASRLYSLDPDPNGGTVVGMQGGSVDVFAEVLAPTKSLIVVGAGHIAQPVATIGRLLGFDITVVDDRPEFANSARFPDADRIIVAPFAAGMHQVALDEHTYVVLVTRGHVHDQECLRLALNTPAAYIGMIGSKVRIRTVMRSLREEGFSLQDLSRVYGPIGLDIGSQTPAEIAVAIMAEIVNIARQGRAPHLSLRGSFRGPG